MADKPWGGRFTEGTDRRVEEFTESISFDRRLYEHDIRGSIAHTQMLAHVNLITDLERDQIIEGLHQIQTEIAEDRFDFSVEKEDIHMHIESALIDRIGDVGRKLHTARSRNDQVATDLKLWIRDSIETLDSQLQNLQRAFLSLGERHPTLTIPGYTHLQRAQPVLFRHYTLAYIEKLDRDRDRLSDAKRRMNLLPLGACALAGTTLPIDRAYVAAALDFDGVATNSLDVANDRDFLIETVFCLSLIATHLSGWAEEWIIWNTVEFGFLKLPDTVCTGSSIMPQKKNPDVLELIRGRTGRVVGSLQTLLMLVKGLPLAYNRDLQEDKPPLFNAVDSVMASLDLALLVVEGAAFDEPRILASLDKGFLDATTLMEEFITKGIPQRTAHELVGKLVTLAESRGCRLSDLNQDDFRNAHPALQEGIETSLGAANVVHAFQSDGSTAPDSVQRQVQLWNERLSR